MPVFTFAHPVRTLADVTTERGPVQMNVRLSPSTIDELDRIVEERNAADTWPKITRTDLVREAVEQWLARERVAAGKGKRKR